MQRDLLIKKTEDNINYQIKKLNFLCAMRKKEQVSYIKDFLAGKNRTELSDDSSVINQILSGSIIILH